MASSCLQKLGQTIDECSLEVGGVFADGVGSKERKLPSPFFSSFIALTLLPLLATKLPNKVPNCQLKVQMLTRSKAAKEITKKLEQYLRNILLLFCKVKDSVSYTIHYHHLIYEHCSNPLQITAEADSHKNV